jgi:serine/threonine protein kinase
LHAYNFLVHKEHSGTYRAVIADLGRTVKIQKLKGLPAQMTRKACAPEGFAFKKLKGKDYFATDIYALGCIFYNLLHNKEAPWQTESLRSDHYTRAQKKAMVRKNLKKTNNRRRKELQSRQGSLSVKERAELLILKMVQIKPKNRGTSRELVHEMDKILRS